MLTAPITEGYFDPAQSSVGDLAALVSTRTDLRRYPHAVDLVREVVLYDAATFEQAADDPVAARTLMIELTDVLRDGPGVLMIRDAVARPVVEPTVEVLWRILERQRAESNATGDHFAMAGTNDRIWNAVEKLAIADPACFVDYYASPAIALTATAWLGPGYQVTSQINIVNPGGVAQSPHRDYHLGFMSDEWAAAWPVHAHMMSPLLTLQGAVAHVDMPVETGPTKVLPHSQKYPPGYVVWKQPEVIDLFEREHVQLPLGVGDALFFNPAVYHAAGTNRTPDVRRMANLLQIGSAFGRSTEAVDRARTVRSIYPELLRRVEAGEPEPAIHRALAAAAEGYAFPTDLDRDPPIGGLAPATQADLVRTALAERWNPDRLAAALSDHAARRRA